MQNYLSALTKTKFHHMLITSKKPYLADHHQRVAGKVISVTFDKKHTTFEVTDFIKISKKLRSNTVEVKTLDIFQYNFVGLCIAHKKDPYITDTSFLIRNAFDRIPYELNACLFSPIVESIRVLPSIEKLIHITHSKYFYLRNKSMPESTIYFDYVIDMYDYEVLHQQDPKIKELEENYEFNI